jgi:hypothetical protein
MNGIWRKEELFWLSMEEGSKEGFCAWKLLKQTVPMGWSTPFFSTTYSKQSGFPRPINKWLLIMIMEYLIQE